MSKHTPYHISAWMIFCALATTIFVAEVLIMLLFTEMPPLSSWSKAVIDASLLLTLTLPVLYFIAFRPLKRFVEQHQRIEEDLRIASAAFETKEGIVVTDKNNVILRVNRTFSESTGYTAEELIGKQPTLFESGLQDANFYAQMWETLNQYDVWHGELLDQRKNGEIYPKQLTITAIRGQDKAITHYVGMHTDISDLRKFKGDLTRAGLHDPLTGLPNRLLFSERIHHALARDLPYHMLAVVMIDLDHFKPINDTYGHEMGDKVLIEVAQQLKNSTRDSDVVARLGGDEFVILLNELTGIEACHQTLERLRVALSNPYKIDGLKLHLSASIGATLYPEDSSDADSLLRHADEAMYLAKHSGKNRYVLFDATAAAKRTSLQQKLANIQAALENEEFTLYYQPQVDMKAGIVIGMEALIRWQSPQHGRIQPGEFMPLVENSELAIPIGCFVLKAAIAQLAEWYQEGFNWRMCINISPRHLEHPNFVDDLETILVSYPEIPPDMVELEIVESAALQDIEKAVSTMQAVRKLGVQFALDDFGTGHASLTYLRRLPVRTLKIDQTFVRDMLDDPSDLIMIEGITSLANTFEHEVLAEGVENANLGALLIQIGCHQAQGYAIARPMPANEIVNWAKKWQPDVSWQLAARRLWRREDLPLLYAAMSHRIWVNNMQSLVDGRSSAIPQLNERLCRFGHWQFGLGFKNYGELQEFAEIVPLHSAVHKTGHTIIQFIEAQQHEAAKNEMQTLHALRDQLIAKMDLLADRVALE